MGSRIPYHIIPRSLPLKVEFLVSIVPEGTGGAGGYTPSGNEHILELHKVVKPLESFFKYQNTHIVRAAPLQDVKERGSHQHNFARPPILTPDHQ